MSLKNMLRTCQEHVKEPHPDAMPQPLSHCGSQMLLVGVGMGGRRQEAERAAMQRWPHEIGSACLYLTRFMK